MTNGQRFKILADVKIQGKSFSKGTTFEVQMQANNHEIENHIVVVVGKQGKPLTMKNPSNFVGINQKTINSSIENNVIEVLV